MDILIRSSFDNVETAEMCIKRIRDTRWNVSEITLTPPKRHNDDRNGFLGPSAGLLGSMNAGTTDNTGGGFALGAFSLGFRDHNDTVRADVYSSDATIEIVTDSIMADRIRGIIINSGGRDTAVF